MRQEKLWPWYSAEALEDVRARIASGQNLGAQGADDDVLSLEAAAAHTLGDGDVATGTLSFSSGTSALFTAYRALGLGGTVVLAPSYTFRATVSALVAAGCDVRFYDVSPVDGRVDLDRLPEAELARASAIVVTHMHGILNDLTGLRALADRFGLAVIEDCSHAHGARDASGRPAGAAADVAVYSLGTTKLVSGGLGGVAFFRDGCVLERAVVLGQQKWRALRDAPDDPRARTGGGYHHRMSPLAAILARDHLRSLETNLAAKQAGVDRVVAALHGSGTGLRAVRPAAEGRFQGLYQLHVRVPPRSSRDAVCAHLRRAGVRARVPGRALHLERGFAPACRPVSPLTGTTDYLDDVIELDGLDLHDPSTAEVAVHVLRGALAELERRPA